MGYMPRVVRLSLNGITEAALEGLTRPVRVVIIGYLMKEGPSFRREIADALSIAPPTVNDHLSALEALGLVEADSVPRGGRPKYRAVPQRVLELYEALGDALHINDVQ